MSLQLKAEHEHSLDLALHFDRAAMVLKHQPGFFLRKHLS